LRRSIPRLGLSERDGVSQLFSQFTENIRDYPREAPGVGHAWRGWLARCFRKTISIDLQRCGPQPPITGWRPWNYATGKVTGHDDRTDVGGSARMMLVLGSSPENRVFR
jgi:hypothetical protein